MSRWGGNDHPVIVYLRVQDAESITLGDLPLHAINCTVAALERHKRSRRGRRRATKESAR